jgi:hypothetical protein
MSTLADAVASDRFSGLSGFKRGLSGNPTRIPSNLPAFRGVSGQPGGQVKAPAIRSSANVNYRKTNALVPYARVCSVGGTEHIGRASPGDVVFVSKAAHGLPGYAHSRFSKVVGIDFLNRSLGKDFLRQTRPQGGAYSHILPKTAGMRVADDWRKVPFLAEWALDGVVLSSDKPVGERDSHLFNIGIQGVCPVNNGYDAGFVVSAARTVGVGGSKNHTTFDFAAAYQGPAYREYPLQVFDRKIRPMQSLFVGLVATEHISQGAKKASLAQENVKALEKNVAEAETAEKAAKQQELEARMRKLDDPTDPSYVSPEQKLSLELYKRMGWWGNPTGSPHDKTSGAPDAFYTFKFITFSSGDMWEMDQQVIPVGTHGKPAVKRRRLDDYPTNDKTPDLRRLVGAWRLGTVMDIKAAKMPHYEGGPAETGCRVTANVCIQVKF